MEEKVLKIGIMSRKEFAKRTIAIAKGEVKSGPEEPDVWFESLQSAAQVLSNENKNLLRVIVEQRPDSIKDLEHLSGRKCSSLSRTLKTMERYGLVELVKNKRNVKPIVKATHFKVEFNL
jgi:predicted transcriptional regulator